MTEQSLCLETLAALAPASARGRYPVARSIQVEINKKLFMDTRTFRATEGLARVRADLDRLLRVLAERSVKGRDVVTAAAEPSRRPDFKPLPVERAVRVRLVVC